VADPRSLALADPGGDSAADREIRALARSAEQSQRVDAWVLLGRAWVRKARESVDPGFYLNANAAADVALGLDPGDRAALNLRGLVLMNEHRFAEAMEFAEQVLARDPDDPMALGTRSDALLELGRFSEAAEAVQRMVDLKPNLPSYARASYIRWLQGDAAAAKRIIRLAIDAHDPRDPEPWAWVVVQAAMIFWHEGDYDGADKGFDRALEAVREYPSALVGKGRVALAKGAFARAIDLLERADRQSPLPETAWLLGDAKRAAGDAAGAAAAYGQVVKRGRQSDRRLLAQYYATRGLETEEALRLIEAERKTRADITTEDVHAWALYRAGKLSEARAASDRALSLGTKEAQLLYHAGAIRIAAGERPEGEKLVREALRRNPKFDLTGAAEAEEMLANAGKQGEKAR
jgi:tetratricopeptide (TPR) repeat protein